MSFVRFFLSAALRLNATATLMGCPDGKARQDFVPVVGEGFASCRS